MKSPIIDKMVDCTPISEIHQKDLLRVARAFEAAHAVLERHSIYVANSVAFVAKACPKKMQSGMQAIEKELRDALDESAKLLKGIK